jgi:hypothetical protein
MRNCAIVCIKVPLSWKLELLSNLDVNSDANANTVGCDNQCNSNFDSQFNISNALCDAKLDSIFPNSTIDHREREHHREFHQHEC